MSHVKNVIQTSDVFAAGLQHMNRDSLLALLQQVMQISEQANHDLSVDLNGKITTARTELQASIDVVSAKTDQAMAAAKILEGAEIDQLIQAFKKFIETTGMQELIQDAAVQIGETTYQLGSVLEVLALADKDAQLEILHSPDGSEIVGVRYTLVDGYVVTMNATKVADADSGNYRYTFQTNDWRGLTASFVCTYRQISSSLSFFGRQLTSYRFLPVLHTNLVFDLCNKFTLLKPITNADVTPDLSGIAPAAGSASVSASASTSSTTTVNASASASSGSGSGANPSATGSSNAASNSTAAASASTSSNPNAGNG